MTNHEFSQVATDEVKNKVVSKFFDYIMGALGFVSFYVITTYFIPNIPKIDISGIAFFQWFTLALFLLIGGIIAAAIIHWIKPTLVPSIAAHIKKDRDDTRKTLQDWNGHARKVLDETQKGVLREMWLSRPWEYLSLLKNVDDEYATRMLPLETHIDEITLYGTMVGFAFLLPEAIRNHSCRSHGAFKNLTIYASDAVIDGKELVNYPLFLVAQLIRELTNTCQSFKAYVESDPYMKFEVNIGYFPHDLLNACIHMKEQEIAVLQALDINLLTRILSDEQNFQIGFRYKNTDDPNEAFDRFKDSLNNLNDNFPWPREKWAFSNVDGFLKCEISNPHWYINSDNRVALLQNAELYHSVLLDRPTTKHINNAKVEHIKKLYKPQLTLIDQGIDVLVNALYNATKTEGTSARDITTLSNLVEDKKNEWYLRYNMACPCCD